MNSSKTTKPAQPQYTEGVKFDLGKPPISLIPYEAMVAEAEVLAYGAQKYALHNWRKGMAWSRVIDAALRHLHAYANGEDTDPESGLSHLAHARCCIGFLLSYQQTGAGTDDRHPQHVEQLVRNLPKP